MNSSPHYAKKEAASGQEAAVTSDSNYTTDQSTTTAGVNTTNINAQILIAPSTPAAVDFEISRVVSIRSPDRPDKVSFRAVLKDIQGGTWASAIAKIREVHSRNGKEAAGPLKQQLPAILFSGTFSRRCTRALIAHSGLICADLDDLGDKLSSLKQNITTDPHTLACFVSPSGNGLKVVLRCDPKRAHKESFAAVERYFLEKFEVQIDTACSDVSRPCFVSHDPEAYVAAYATEIPYPPEPESFKAPDEGAPRPCLTGGSRPGDDYNVRGDVLRILERHRWTELPTNRWRRPDKPVGVSAIWNRDTRTFWVFSNNAAPLEANRLYRPWHLYALFEHGGDFKAAAKALADQGYGANAEPPQLQPQELRSLLDSRRYDPSRKPKPPIPLLKLKGVTICTPGNITTISGQAKVGKSSVVQAILAAYMGAAHPTKTCDALGFEATHSSGKKILHFDTEQSLYDSYRLVERAVARFGGPFPQGLFESYSLAGLSAQKLRECIRLMIAEVAGSTGLSLVVIDGVADLIEDVNDQGFSNALVAELQRLAIDYNCAIICVLHENPNQDGGKMRGHLGSQLERKAESNLRLKLDKGSKGQVTLYGEKMRGAPIYERDGIVFTWDPMKDRHVSIGSASALKVQKEREKYQEEADELMDRLGNNPAPWSTLTAEIGKMRNIGKSGAEDRFNKLKKCGALIRDPQTKLWTNNPI
jgi:hypothetical protein